MLLSNIAADLKLPVTGGDAEITSVEYDSRKVKDGSLFCCMKGLVSDGHSFVIFNDLFTYKTKGKDLVISGCSPLIMPSADENSDEISAEYKVEGDKLTIIDDKNTNVLTKVA